MGNAATATLTPCCCVQGATARNTLTERHAGGQVRMSDLCREVRSDRPHPPSRSPAARKDAEMSRSFKKYRRDYKELAAKLEVQAFLPPESSQNLAQDRTDGMVQYFHEAIDGIHWWHVRSLVSALARSCYLQGVSDCAEAFARKKLIFPEEGRP